MLAPEALFLYQDGLQAYQSGDSAQARSLIERCLAHSPLSPEALLLFGVLQESEDAVPALCVVEQAVMRDPTSATAWYNLGVLEGERGNLAEAAACYRRCIGLNPTHLDALGNGCEAMRRLERFDEALAWADRRLVFCPDDWRSHLNRAVCLFHRMQLEEAEVAFDRARALSQGQPIVEWERFSLDLHRGRFAQAWDAFEHRFAVGHLNGVFHYPFEQPLWRGESLTARRILIHNEQGLGDQIMFACALPEVIAAADSVTLVVAPTLVPVFAASFPTARVLPACCGAFAGDHPEPSWLHDLGLIDFQVPIGSLMALLRRDAASFANSRPYLQPSQEARNRWKGFSPGRGLRVGLCWASNPAMFRRDSALRAVKKSMPLDALAPLGDIPGLQLVSVLNWSLAEEPTVFAQCIADLSQSLLTFDDTAALIEQMDIVITVDTSVAHMAGALGKETWLLLHHFPDCRWGLTAENSYWYPHMRMFRQRTLGDWGSVVADVALALRERSAS